MKTHHRALLGVLLAACALHAVYLAFGLHKRTYDAFSHIFFAGHYAQNWWNTWNLKWYGGFDQLSYPPLCHQLVALAGKLTGRLDGAYALVQLLGLGLLFLGAYGYARLWTSSRGALWSVVLAALLTSVFQAAYQFGQLPTLFSLAVLLLSIPQGILWSHRGQKIHLLAAVFLMGISAVSHHVTFLVAAPFFVIAPVLRVLFARGAFHLSIVFSRKTGRIFIWMAMSAIVGAGVLFPFFYYVHTSEIYQKEIFHASRDSFLLNSGAGLNFFLVPNSFLFLFFPLFFLQAWREKRWRFLFSFWGILAVFGLGGTTPFPRWLMGENFRLLTFDRYTLWSTLMILPFAGSWMMHASKRIRFFFLGVVIAAHALVAMMTCLTQFQPKVMDLTPVVRYLEENNPQNAYRYLTLGFGAQMGWLGVQSSALNIDGNYHTARPIPELRQSGIESLDSAKYFGAAGVKTLNHFLKNPGRYALKYIFSNDEFYTAQLQKAGWRAQGYLNNGVRVWVSDSMRRPVSVLTQKRPTRPDYRHLLWGSYPGLAAAGGIALGIAFYRRIRRRKIKIIRPILLTILMLGAMTHSGFAKVEIQGGEFFEQGKLFYPLGVNYYPKDKLWEDFWAFYDERESERDLARIHELGFNTVRIFIQDSLLDAEESREKLIRNLKHFMRTADHFDLKVIITLFDWAQLYPDQFHSKALARLDFLIPQFRDEPALFAWDLKNEADHDYQFYENEGVVHRWLLKVFQRVRELDPKTLITVGWFSALRGGAVNEKLDFISFHFYGHAKKAAAEFKAHRASFPGKPVILQEVGFSTFPVIRSERAQKKYFVETARAASQANLNGMMIWTLHDYDPHKGRSRPLTENHFGIIKTDGRLKEAALYFKKLING